MEAMIARRSVEVAEAAALLAAEVGLRVILDRFTLDGPVSGTPSVVYGSRVCR